MTRGGTVDTKGEQLDFGADPPVFETVLAAFAVWRVAHLLARESGPWDSVAKLHARLHGSAAGRLLDCPYCLSLWLALLPAALLAPRIAHGVLLWLAISGGACLIERLFEAPPG